MSRPKSLDFSDEIRPEQLETERGTFATFRCSPRGSSLPHGQALIVPGFTGSKEDFAALLPLLAQSGWESASYDQRGQFETLAVPGDDFSLSGLARDAAAVSEALFGTDSEVHIVGHSFGGLVAGTAAIEHRDLWASVVLMCSGPGGFAEPKRSELLRAAETLERSGLDEAYRLSRQRDRDRGRPEPEPDIEHFLRTRFLSNSPESLAAFARLLADAPDLTGALAGLDVPVAVVRGEDDDAWSHDVQDQLAEALGTRVIVIPEAAHSPAVEQPEDTRDALARIWLG